MYRENRGYYTGGFFEVTNVQIKEFIIEDLEKIIQVTPHSKILHCIEHEGVVVVWVEVMLEPYFQRIKLKLYQTGDCVFGKYINSVLLYDGWYHLYATWLS